MKTRIALLTVTALCSTLFAATGDIIVQKKTATGVQQVYVTPQASTLLGFNSSGVFGKIPNSTFALSDHTQPWSSIVSTPNTLEGYGITDAQPFNALTTILGSDIDLSHGAGEVSGLLETTNGGTGGGYDNPALLAQGLLTALVFDAGSGVAPADGMMLYYSGSYELGGGRWTHLSGTTAFGRSVLQVADAAELRALAEVGSSGGESGSVVEMVRANYTGTASGTTNCFVYSNTSLRAMTEGDQYMTISYTPTSATNRLRVKAFLNLGSSVNAHAGVLLARSGDTNARAQSQTLYGNTLARTDYVYPCQVELDEVAGGTSLITYNVRAGGGTTGTYYMNRAHAGVYPVGLLSYIEITEYVP